NTFTDQATRSPGAKFWIPSLDEWIKAAHYDPDRWRDGEAGYWRYSHTSDDPPIPGAPGEGQTSAGYDPPGVDEAFYIPLGSYPDVQSPWGLLDTTGGAAEWTEEIHAQTFRRADGADAGFTFPELDELGF